MRSVILLACLFVLLSVVGGLHITFDRRGDDRPLELR